MVRAAVVASVIHKKPMKKHMKLGLCLAGLVLVATVNLSAQEPKKETSAAAVTDPKAVLAGIPRDVIGDLRPGSRKMVDAAGKASMVTAKNAEGKTGTFKMTLRAVEQFQRPEAPDVKRYRLHAKIDSVRESGVSFNVHLMSVPDVSENDKVAKLGPGSKITVTGKISNAEILGRQLAELHIDVMDSKLE
jgi:hypothetical protein